MCCNHGLGRNKVLLRIININCVKLNALTACIKADLARYMGLLYNMRNNIIVRLMKKKKHHCREYDATKMGEKQIFPLLYVMVAFRKLKYSQYLT